MSDWQPHVENEGALRGIETKIALEPGVVRHRFKQALLLTELGRLPEAKQVYVEILKQDLSQFAAFNNLGAVLVEMGFFGDAIKVYQEVVARFPDRAAGHVNLARVLYKTGKLPEARNQYEVALRLDPGHEGAHRGLAHLLTDLKEDAAAFEHLQKGFCDEPWTVAPYRGSKKPVRLLSLISARGGNSPIHRFFDNTIFLTTEMVVDFYAGTSNLPAHDIVINAVGDADRCPGSLDAVDRVLEQTNVPVVNPPGRVRTTSREGNARRLGALEAVITPHVGIIPREILAASKSRLNPMLSATIEISIVR